MDKSKHAQKTSIDTFISCILQITKQTLPLDYCGELMLRESPLLLVQYLELYLENCNLKQCNLDGISVLYTVLLRNIKGVCQRLISMTSKNAICLLQEVKTTCQLHVTVAFGRYSVSKKCIFFQRCNALWEICHVITAHCLYSTVFLYDVDTAIGNIYQLVCNTLSTELCSFMTDPWT